MCCLLTKLDCETHNYMMSVLLARKLYFYESSKVVFDCGFHCLMLGVCSHFNPKLVKEEAETRTERLPSGE